MSDHERIYLDQYDDEDFGRQWHTKPVFTEATEYVRADIAKAEIDQLRAELAGARNKALEAAAGCVESRIEDMRELDKFNRSYALRLTALAAVDIRALKDVSIDGR